MEDKEKEWYKDIGWGDTEPFIEFGNTKKNFLLDGIEIECAELLRYIDSVWDEIISRKW